MPFIMWGKATGIYDPKGTVIAAIQSILVSRQETLQSYYEGHAEERYIGGISSITVKFPGNGMTGAITGAIGASTGGYGVYATNQRLLIIHNPELDASRRGGLQFGEFIMDELFGTTVDTRPRDIADLENKKVIAIERKNIASIEVKTPLLLAGHLSFNTRTGESFRIYIDHRKAFMHLEQLLRLHYPEILMIE
jgi:hypothetical protein